jgi:hypothetical protein
MTQIVGGKATGTLSSAEMLAADRHRDKVTIMLYDGTSPVSIGVGEAAVADEGLVLRVVGSVCEIDKYAATKQINIIGNGGIVTYQTGPVTARLNSVGGKL